MFKRFLIVGRRNIHLMTSFCSKIEQIKFSNVEKEKILSIVNNSNMEDLCRFSISQSNAKKLHSVRERSGKAIESIDEILNITGFGVNVLNRFCRSILNEEVSETFGSEKLKTSRNRSYTFPALSIDLIKHVNSFTSIHCGMAGLSWSTFEIIPNEMTKMTDWDCRPLPQTKLNLYELAAFMSSVLKDVPKSDFFVFENPNTPNVGSSNYTINIQIMQMIGMASVIAAQNNTLPISIIEGLESGTMNVAYLRKFLFARLFKLYVGTERVSATDHVEKLMRMSRISGVMDENIQSVVDVDLSLRSMYSLAERSNKDFLGCSFLLGLAFLRLSLLKCPKSMQLVAK